MPTFTAIASSSITLLIASALVVGVGVLFIVAMRRRNLHLWIDDYVRQSAERRAAGRGPITDVLVCVADHYEPRWETVDEALEAERVARWTKELPEILKGRVDSDGKAPQHSFFYPYEEYREPLLKDLVKLCADGYGEIEIHLHHGFDTEESLRVQLADFVKLLHWRHGVLGTDPTTGAPGYAFIHGNWALNNSGNGPEECGVNDEIRVLLETGCYVDMTLPSAPASAQVNMVNRIYYATSSKDKPCGHATGELVRVGGECPSADHLMLLSGPLGLNWQRRKFGVLPRIENGELADNAPVDAHRVRLWEQLASTVAGQPDWRFIKLHSHGVQEKDHGIMLGEDCRTMYEELERQYRDRPGYRLHYVSAREMYNIARAAEAGETGNPNHYRDYFIRPPGYLAGESG